MMENELPESLRIINNFIFLKPHVVVRILKENGIQVSKKPTLPEIIKKTLIALSNENEGFIEDLEKAIISGDEATFDPITLGISGAFSIASSIMAAQQAKKQRRAMVNMKMMELASNEKLSLAEIQAMKEQGRIEILSNTILSYSQSLQSESTARQRDTSLFVGIMGVGLAVMYATVQLFKA